MCSKVKWKYLLLFITLSACEYERIASPEPDCIAPVLQIESVQNTTCVENSGEIVANVSGNDAYEFSIDESGFTEVNLFSDLSAGTYTIQARVKNSNCVSDFVEVTVSNEDGMQIELSEAQNSTCGGETGMIRVSQQGGVEPVEYILNNERTQSEPEFIELAKGNYTILARDANGCEDEISNIEILSSVSFTNDIKSIIATNCAVSGCHNGSQPPNLSEDSDIIANASRIKSRTANGTMPPAGRPDLTEAEIEAIACWVDDGALNN